MKTLILLLFTLPVFSQGIPIYKFFNPTTNMFEFEYEEVIAMVKVYEGYFLMEDEIYNQYDKIDSLSYEIDIMSNEVELRYSLQIQALQKSNEQLSNGFEDCLVLSDKYYEETTRLNKELSKSQLNLKLEKIKSWVFGSGAVVAIIYILTTVL